MTSQSDLTREFQIPHNSLLNFNMIFKKKTKKLLQIGLTLQKSLTFFEEIP